VQEVSFISHISEPFLFPEKEQNHQVSVVLILPRVEEVALQMKNFLRNNGPGREGVV